MKRLICFAVLWICGLGFFLSSAWAQQVVISQPIGTNQSSEYRQPGDVLVRMANAPATNAPTVPLQDKIQVWTDAIQNMLIGAGTIVTAALLLWGRIMQLRASVVPTLVKTVESHGTPELKAAIEQAALRAGVEPALNKAVEANTVSDVSDGLTVEPLPLKPVTLPVVELPKPNEVKPI